MNHSVPDCALDAEAAVVGACLLAPEQLDLIAWLSTGDFFSTPHRRVIEAARALRAAGTPADAVTVGVWLRDNERLADVGGLVKLAELLDACPYVEDVQHYARIVAQAAQVRRLDVAAAGIVARCRGAIPDRSALLAEARASIEEATETTGDLTHGAPIGALVAEVISAKRTPATATRRRTLTGFERFDQATHGLDDGDLWVLAARPGMGKTSMASNVALNASATGDGVILFSLEMPREQIADRVVIGESKIDRGAYQSGQLSSEQWAQVDYAHEQVRQLPFWVDDSKGLTVADIQARALDRKQRWAKEGVPLRLVMVDYLQLIKPILRKTSNREQEMAEVSKGLKAMAGLLKCPVLALAQLTRECEKQGRRPRPSDIRDTGQIEQDADGIVFLHRDKETARGCVDLIIAKQRNGPVGTLPLAWWPRYLRFETYQPYAHGQVPQGAA